MILIIENNKQTDLEVITKYKQFKKIPHESRKQKINVSSKKYFYKKIVLHLKNNNQFLRTTIQISFALLCIWIGIEFYFFVKWGTSNGQIPFHHRPPGVEGFLPISALISLKYFIQTGIINEIHPSGLFILIAIITISLILKKSFCSWLCPIGTLSEGLWKLGKNFIGKNLSFPKWIDYPLRSLKYFLLLFFIWAIAQMSIESLKTFIYSPYNKIADIKMYFFFANITTFSLWTIIILMILSIFIKNFWCRYLCPYGALLGTLSWLSPLKITRNKSTCINCELCTKVCPSNIKVHTIRRVISDECTSCLECVNICPVKDTLAIQTSFTNKHIPNWVFAGLIVGIFVAITGVAMLTGNWQNKISKEEYLKRFQELNKPIYQHFQGNVLNYGRDD